MIIKSHTSARCPSAKMRPCRSLRERRGLSLVEVLGCLLALVGGVWLGIACLGIDVQHVTYVALSESALLDKVPRQWRPVDPQAAAAPTPAEMAQAVDREFAALRQQVGALRSASGASSQTSVGLPASSDSVGAMKEATLAFWNRLGEIARDQKALEGEAELAANAQNAIRVAVVKVRISRFAATAIRAIPSDGVDPSLVRLGDELADWNERAGDLYDEAVRIWESPARGTKKRADTKTWERKHAQHTNESQLLDDKVAALGESLTRVYGSEFERFSVR